MAPTPLCKDLKKQHYCLLDKHEQIRIPPRRLATHALGAGLVNTSRLLRMMRDDLKQFKTGPCRACADMQGDAIPRGPSVISDMEKVFEAEKNEVLHAAATKPHGLVCVKPHTDTATMGYGAKLYTDAVAMDYSISAVLRSAWLWLGRRFGGESAIVRSLDVLRRMRGSEEEITRELGKIRDSFADKP